VKNISSRYGEMLEPQQLQTSKKKLGTTLKYVNCVEKQEVKFIRFTKMIILRVDLIVFGIKLEKIQIR
jgi:hypothetical protein